MKVHSKIVSAEDAYAFFSGGRKTFNWNGKMVRPLCYALVQEEENQGPNYLATISIDFPVNALGLNSKLQDVDDSKWETSKDGTVVKKQPGDAQKITLFNVVKKSKFQVRFSSLLFKEQVRGVEPEVEDPILRESPTTPGRMRWRRTCKR